jgi:hypothetical protein
MEINGGIPLAPKRKTGKCKICGVETEDIDPPFLNATMLEALGGPASYLPSTIGWGSSGTTLTLVQSYHCFNPVQYGG